MGIPRLRRHLLPFHQTVLLQGSPDPGHEKLECIKSVVIDGPSLVYNVYSRLLSWFSANEISIIDSLPTCDEVSRGVVLYLMHLRMLGVEIESIYFDGALPQSKRETRVARLEGQRQKLELFCAQTKNGFKGTKSCSCQRTINPENVLRSRPTPAKYVNVPANAFMISAVFEDLKCRWNWGNISSVISGILPFHLPGLESFPWAAITSTVPGEADAHCAYTARLKSSSILTNDSDLLLYDIGIDGSVIFLDSMELSRWDPDQPLASQIKAALVRPSLAVQRLGVPSLLAFACELKAYPESSLAELIQRSQNATIMKELSNSHRHHRFAVEYQSDQCQVPLNELNQVPGHLDNRISELFWQYELQGKYDPGKYPHVYLPILNEDHTKRCAWTKGREYRDLAYSILNISRPLEQRPRHVCEFVRRGRRIAEDKIELKGKTWISARIKSLEIRLGTPKANLQNVDDPQSFWTMFALGDCYGSDAEFTLADLQKLKRFLTLGYMGKQLSWADIHLTAQIHAVLYSLRILQQILALSNSEDLTASNLRSALRTLPKLHDMKPSCQCAERSITTAQLSDSFECVAQESQLRGSGSTADAVQSPLISPHAVNSMQDHDENNAPSPSSNMYELLQG
ncbi:hypothetical protein BDV06DRAFT_208518 [Aspergillus oleicola]